MARDNRAGPTGPLGQNLPPSGLDRSELAKLDRALQHGGTGPIEWSGKFSLWHTRLPTGEDISIFALPNDRERIKFVCLHGRKHAVLLLRVEPLLLNAELGLRQALATAREVMAAGER